MYIKNSLEKYIEDLSARLPAPGGGSASAACGALGVALILMVSNFTLGKEKYSAYENDIKEIINKAEGLKRELMKFIDKDVETYQNVSKAYKAPEEKKKAIMQKALKEALSVPLDICRTTYEAIKLIEPLLVKGNRGLLSDVGVAASMLYSAFESAKINVDINLKNIDDEAFVNKVMEETQEMFGEVKRITAAVISEVNNRLKLKV